MAIIFLRGGRKNLQRAPPPAEIFKPFHPARKKKQPGQFLVLAGLR
jgi:hypothetical protein